MISAPVPVEFLRKSPGLPDFYVAGVVGFLSAQRFAIPYLSAYVCLIPIILAITYWKRPNLRNMMVVLSLLSSVDLGDEVYFETTGLVRYFIYLMAIAVLLSGPGLSTRRLQRFVPLVLLLTVTTTLNFGDIDAYTFGRDVLTLVLVVIALCIRPVDSFTLVNSRMLNWFVLGILLSEVINLLFFYDKTSGHYLNYQSVKSIVVFSSIFYLGTGRWVLGWGLVAVTILVLIAYATRALFLSYLLILAFVLLRKMTLHGAVAAAMVALVAVFVGPGLLPSGVVDSSRIFSIFFSNADSLPALELLRALDPVRYVEHELFFDRNWLRILLGDGLGSGFIDTSGAFSFVPFNSGAFSDRELIESRFYRLHDPWIYFGLRFGLIAIIGVYLAIFFRIIQGQEHSFIIACLAFAILNCASFSISGLLLTALLLRELFNSTLPASRALKPKEKFSRLAHPPDRQ